MGSTANVSQVNPDTELITRISVFCNAFNLAVSTEIARENRKEYAEWKMKIYGTAPDFWPFTSRDSNPKPVWPDVELIREPAPGVEALDLIQVCEVIDK
jgi:hypothetical protein